MQVRAWGEASLCNTPQDHLEAQGTYCLLSECTYEPDISSLSRAVLMKNTLSKQILCTLGLQTSALRMEKHALPKRPLCYRFPVEGAHAARDST